MLDKTDLEQIQSMISDSEARMAKTMDDKLAESEARMAKTMDDKLAESEARMTKNMDDKLAESERNIMQNVNVLMESKFDPKFQLLTEMIQSILDRLPESEEIEDHEDRLQVLEATVRRHSREILALKRAN